MKILFFACTLLSALLLTLPPFLCRQTGQMTDSELSSDADGFVTDAETQIPETTAYTQDFSEPTLITTVSAETESEPPQETAETEAVVVRSSPPSAT